MRDGRWEYTIRAYKPTNKGGGLVLETVHVGTASRDTEIAVFRDRMKRGEIDHIEVIAHVEPYDTRLIFSTDPVSTGEKAV
jgi:hypothetical protein